MAAKQDFKGRFITAGHVTFQQLSVTQASAALEQRSAPQLFQHGMSLLR
jgi:hypothetical protein